MTVLEIYTFRLESILYLKCIPNNLNFYKHLFKHVDHEFKKQVLKGAGLYSYIIKVFVKFFPSACRGNYKYGFNFFPNGKMVIAGIFFAYRKSFHKGIESLL